MADLVPVKVKGNIGTIEDNLDSVEISIREKIQEYTAIVVTESGIKEAKRSLADIRKEKKTLDDERKAIKRQWMEPYDAFEKRARQIIALYDGPINAINSQLDGFEERRKEAKRQRIRAVYDLVKGDLADWLPLDRIYDPRWENATYTEKQIRKDMGLIFDQMKVSISTIKSMGSEFEEDALRVLRETGSLQDAVVKINGLQEQKERAMGQARQEAEREYREKGHPGRELGQRKAELQAEKEKTDVSETCGWPGEQALPPEPRVPEEAPFAPERILTVMVRVGENDLGLLKEFLDREGLGYEVM